MPLMLVTSVVGLGVALLQAVTQINEPSLNFIPKLVVSGLMILLMGSWMLQTLVNFVGHMLDGPTGG
jgi:flagellar biosynthesis protein FliQ